MVLNSIEVKVFISDNTHTFKKNLQNMFRFKFTVYSNSYSKNRNVKLLYIILYPMPQMEQPVLLLIVLNKRKEEIRIYHVSLNRQTMWTHFSAN